MSAALTVSLPAVSINCGDAKCCRVKCHDIVDGIFSEVSHSTALRYLTDAHSGWTSSNLIIGIFLRLRLALLETEEI